MSGLLTYAGAAAAKGVSVHRLRRAVARKELACVKLGHRTVRFRAVDLERWENRQLVKASGE